MLLNRFINSESQRTSTIKKNIIGSFGVKAISICVSFLLVPMTIGYVSSSLYGIWLTISTIVAWIGLFDLGFGNGLRNKLAESLAQKDYEKAKEYISTTYVCIFLIFSTLTIIVYVSCEFINWVSVLNIPNNLEYTVVKVMRIVLIFFCINMILKIQSTVLLAMQRTALSSLVDALGQVLVLISTYILTITTKPSLEYLAFAISCCPIIVYIFSTIWLFKFKSPELFPSFKYVKMEFAKEIINLGIKFFIIQIACLAIYQTINIIISHVAGPESVTEYNVIYKYLSIPLMVFNIIMGPIWSAYTDAYTLNDFEWMKTIYHKLIKLLMITMICLVVMIAFYRIFFNIWLGGKVQIHLSIVLIIGIYISTTLWNNVHSYIINGTGKIKLQLYVSLIGTFLNIPFSLLLGKYYGVLGVIIPVIIFSLIPAIILKIQTNKMLNNNLSGIWAE